MWMVWTLTPFTSLTISELLDVPFTDSANKMGLDTPEKGHIHLDSGM